MPPRSVACQTLIFGVSLQYTMCHGREYRQSNEPDKHSINFNCNATLFRPEQTTSTSAIRQYIHPVSVNDTCSAKLLIKTIFLPIPITVRGSRFHHPTHLYCLNFNISRHLFVAYFDYFWHILLELITECAANLCHFQSKWLFVLQLLCSKLFILLDKSVHSVLLSVKTFFYTSISMSLLLFLSA